MLSSPLRRCLLTNKVLPSDLLIRFEFVRPPPTSSLPSSSRLSLSPSGILHPRFDAHHRARGKGMWVTCWKEAIEALAKKGSYKRVHQSAHLDASTAALRVHSQLARRVVQEAEMLAERAKSWPLPPGGGTGFCPVRRLARDELQGAVEAGAGEGWRPVAVLNCAQLDDPALSSQQPFSSAASFTSAALVPSYRLSRFFAAVCLPPSLSSSSPAPPSSADLSSSDHLLSSYRAHFDDVIGLWDRRRARLLADSASPSSAALPSRRPNTSSDNLYVLYSPILPPSTYPLSLSGTASSTSSSVEAEGPNLLLRRRQAEDVVPVLVALKRCALWLGKGWEVDSK
ncbi:hypothetical protein JCM8547_000147 [Rhodosporidiobolus lusitaniae]